MANIYQEAESQQPIDFLVLGAYNVGKSTLIQKFCQGLTPHNVFHTIGIQFTATTLTYKNNKFRLKFWDTSGNPKYRNLAIQYFKQASAVIIVYDITSYETFHQANEWINQLHDRQLDLPILLFGNKKDLLFKSKQCKNQNRQVSIENGKQLAHKVQGVFVEGCGKTDQMLQQGINELINKYFLNQNKIILEQNQIIPKCFCC